MVSAFGGFLTFLLGSALVVWGVALRGAMEHDGALRAAARMPRGAAQEGI
ncbi:hypothetical protein [Roseicella aerolata]|uniref:Uncharacterized protein n=1 Tax=Roseicella aerolata TaxID=2883479 RepID=A0A9X1IL56_9PROT|nr:hypothetical protein [Roseicella aerolata]MCB4825095.1 hypothetical protein [Roseicella aerolata]